MAINEEQGVMLRAWLTQKGVGALCPACSQQAGWTGGDILLPPVLTPALVEGQAATIPMVQVICNHCHYVRLFAAGPIGLLA
jgi:hypothetical protein